jgi:hypothetical protein
MKKLFTLVSIIALCNIVFAQTQRMVLTEEFTQASCPPCASANPTYNAMCDANPTKLIGLHYQVSWPGVDPMNAENATQVATRVSYYGVTGVPDSKLDGSTTVYPSSLTQAQIDGRYATPAPFALTVSHSISSDFDSIYITVNIQAAQAFTAASALKLHVAVVERDINFTTAPGTNGELDFHWVMRRMLPSEQGTALGSSWTNAQSQVVTLSSLLPWYLRNVNQIGVVAFIQETTSKAVHQAAYSAPLTAQPTNDASTTAITGITTASCNTSVTPSVTIKNLGSTTMTSAVISYDYDVASNWYYAFTNSIPWSGSLAVNATASVPLPTASLTSGPHTLRVDVTSPNNAVDINPNNSLRSVSFSIFPTIGGPTPIVEGYQTATFPPTNWVLNNPDNGFTWSRYTAGGGFGNSTASAKMDFFSSASGQVDELYMPALDLSNTSQNVRLVFDHAYAQYTTENDKLEVQISTNCGASWTSLFNKAGALLSTHAAVGNMAFAPTAADWRYDTVSLDTYRGFNDVLLKFKATSNYGNNLYVDDINLDYYTTLGVPVISASSSVDVYPNPSRGEVNVTYNFNKAQNLTVTVSNVLGSTVQSFNLNNVTTGVLPIDMKTAAKGAYFISIRSNDGTVTKKISIID